MPSFIGSLIINLIHVEVLPAVSHYAVDVYQSEKAGLITFIKLVHVIVNPIVDVK